MCLKQKRCVLTLGRIKRDNQVYIKGKAVDTVETYKYLSVVFDSKLNWKQNINSVKK